MKRFVFILVAILAVVALVAPQAFADTPYSKSRNTGSITVGYDTEYSVNGGAYLYGYVNGSYAVNRTNMAFAPVYIYDEYGNVVGQNGYVVVQYFTGPMTTPDSAGVSSANQFNYAGMLINENTQSSSYSQLAGGRGRYITQYVTNGETSIISVDGTQVFVIDEVYDYVGQYVVVITQKNGKQVEVPYFQYTVNWYGHFEDVP